MTLLSCIDVKDLEKWIIPAAIALVVLIILIVIISVVAKHKKRVAAEEREQQQAQIEQDIQNEVDARVNQRLAEIRDEYLVIPRNVQHWVGDDGQLARGKYVLKSATSSETTFNLRVNGLVEEYKDGDTIFLIVGDTITPVSGSVMIKPCID